MALENLTIVLKAAGSGLEHIVKANIYLSNMPRDFQAMNEVYAEASNTSTFLERLGLWKSSPGISYSIFQFFEKNMMPARTCVGVASLPMGADVEIECVAEVP